MSPGQPWDCATCGGGGLVQLEGAPLAKRCSEVFATMMPCIICARGKEMTRCFAVEERDGPYALHCDGTTKVKLDMGSPWRMDEAYR